jgi:hypothetical protein
MQLNLSDIDKWIPHKLLGGGPETFVEWLYTGQEQFRDSFFDHTIKRCSGLPQNTTGQKNITSVGLLQNWAKEINVAEPSAIIFHISRCGSTIMSQTLASDINHIVLSEVPFFDDIIRTPLIDDTQREALLKDTIKFYSQPRNGYGNKVFIKTDSWHIMFYKQLRHMYPSVPFILLYRNPAEVVRSLNKKPGWHCIPQFVASEFLGIQQPVVSVTDFYEYPIRVMEKYFEGYIKIIKDDCNAFLFNYNEGMLTVAEDIYKVLDVSFTETERRQMNQRLTYHSKTPSIQFSPEPPIESTGEKFANVFELYNNLEEIRRNSK